MTETTRPSSVELVTCPECGLMASVDLGRRDAADFCRNCDYPLFWASQTVISASTEQTGESLRRLPGLAGRAQHASVPCPTCGEPNAPEAVTCLRCGGPMVLPVVVAPEPLPEPEPLRLPEPDPEPEPRNWWWIVIAAFCLLAIVVLVVWNLSL